MIPIYVKSLNNGEFHSVSYSEHCTLNFCSWFAVSGRTGAVFWLDIANKGRLRARFEGYLNRQFVTGSCLQ